MDGVEQNGGGSVGIHLVRKKVYVKARVREEEGFLILKNALLLCNKARVIIIFIIIREAEGPCV